MQAKQILLKRSYPDQRPNEQIEIEYFNEETAIENECLPGYYICVYNKDLESAVLMEEMKEMLLSKTDADKYNISMITVCNATNVFYCF